MIILSSGIHTEVLAVYFSFYQLAKQFIKHFGCIILGWQRALLLCNCRARLTAEQIRI